MPEAMACRFNTTSLPVTKARELDAKYPPFWTSTGLRPSARQGVQIELFCEPLRWSKEGWRPYRPCPARPLPVRLSHAGLAHAFRTGHLPSGLPFIYRGCYLTESNGRVWCIEDAGGFPTALKVVEQRSEATRLAIDAACDWIMQHLPRTGLTSGVCKNA